MSSYYSSCFLSFYTLYFVRHEKSHVYYLRVKYKTLLLFFRYSLLVQEQFTEFQGMSQVWVQVRSEVFTEPFYFVLSKISANQRLKLKELFFSVSTWNRVIESLPRPFTQVRLMSYGHSIVHVVHMLEGARLKKFQYWVYNYSLTLSATVPSLLRLGFRHQSMNPYSFKVSYFLMTFINSRNFKYIKFLTLFHPKEIYLINTKFTKR